MAVVLVLTLFEWLRRKQWIENGSRIGSYFVRMAAAKTVVREWLPGICFYPVMCMTRPITACNKITVEFLPFILYNKLLHNALEVVTMSEGQTDVRQLSANALAFVGDAVFALFVRERMLQRFPGSVHRLHTMSTHYVKASAQARIVMQLIPEFTEDEMSIYKRGRNTKVFTMPKNADLSEYRHATGFEALIGFLHLNKEERRLEEILLMAVKIVEQSEQHHDKAE